MKSLALLPVCLALVNCAALGPMPEWAYHHPSWQEGPPPSRHPASTSARSRSSDVHPSSPWAGESVISKSSSPQKRSYSDKTASSRSDKSTSPRSSFPLDGSVTESYSGNRTYRDRYSGEIVGSEWTSPAGTTTYRDSSGRITGSSSTSPAGTTTYRDSNGSISITSHTTEGTGGDNTTYYRRNGTIVGTKYVSPAGNVTWRDGNGSIISGPNW